MSSFAQNTKTFLLSAPNEAQLALSKDYAFYPLLQAWHASMSPVSGPCVCLSVRPPQRQGFMLLYQHPGALLALRDPLFFSKH